ncbi:MAG TPA: class I SAM-dependent methyltransferase [Thermoplasmata archaeon]|nr:class I SAM-dependent methyltransferase [Thermoplasmata archaeon]
MARRTPPGVLAARALGDRRALPSPEWVQGLTGRSRSEVNGWLRETDAFVPIERRIRAAHRDGGRSVYAQFRAPLELYAIVRAIRPKVIVETGVSSGVSSAHLLLGLRANGAGRLISIDLPTRQKGAKLAEGESIVAIPPGRSSGWAVPPELTEGWDLRIGPAQKLIPAVVREVDGIDLFLHDDLHTEAHLRFELRTLDPRFRPGAVVLADNTKWTGKAFPEFVARHRTALFRRRRQDLMGFRHG